MPTDQIPQNQHFIPLQIAVEMTTMYRKNKEVILAEDFKGQDILPLSETFNKEAFDSLFANPDCKAVRIYYGMSEDLKTHAIIVGVNEKNEDILPSGESERDSDDGIVEDAKRCPPYCPPASPLNTP